MFDFILYDADSWVAFGRVSVSFSGINGGVTVDLRPLEQSISALPNGLSTLMLVYSNLIMLRFPAEPLPFK